MIRDPKILLLGCGYTLRRVAKKLSPKSTVCVVSNQSSADSLRKLGFSNVYVIDLRSEQAQSLLSELPKCDILVDSIPPIKGGSLEASSVGIEKVLRSEILSGLKQIVYLSTTGVFGGKGGEWVDEGTVASPVNDRAQARLWCENKYRDSGVPTTALRIAGIYGPGRGIGTSIKNGRYSFSGHQERWTNRIQVEDLSSIILELIRASVDRALPDVLCACDDRPVMIGELVSFYMEKFSLPRPLVSDTAGDREDLNQRVSNQGLKKFMDITFRYPTFVQGTGTEFLSDE